MFKVDNKDTRTTPIWILKYLCAMVLSKLGESRLSSSFEKKGVRQHDDGAERIFFFQKKIS